MKQSSMWKRALPALGLLAALILFVFAMAVQPAAAASIVVNSAADDIDPLDGECTLREAIIAANTDTAPVGPLGECNGGSGPDTITFAADYTITLGSQLPAVTSEMTITGNGAANTIIQANAAANTATYRVFEVSLTGNLTLDGVTVRHGVCGGGCTSIPADGRGGSIYNLGTLTVAKSTVSDNSANIGGGISNGAGTLTVTDSIISSNSANAGGGIYNDSGTLTVTDSTLYGNSANNFSSGGGIYNNSGTLTVTKSTFSRNTAGFGGGIHGRGTLTVTESTLSGNSAAFDGGGIRAGSGTLTVTNSTLSGNSSGSIGGGIYKESGSLTVTNSTLSGNSSDSGGGMLINGTATVTNSTVTGNSAEGLGGGAEGGGIFVGSGNLTLVRSLVSGNSSANNGAEITRGIGSITADAFNVFGHSGLSNGTAFNGFVPGATDFNATTSGTPTALADILDTTLDDNGGPTETHALVAGSPAIDLGPTAACAAAPVNGHDQRGYGRSVDGNGAASANECDAGAYEYNAQPAFCTGFPMSAGTETQLNEAITCYNLLIAAGSYTIDLTADIDLKASTVAIDNPIGGIDLLLDGQGFTVDGQDFSGVRPFEVESDSNATFDDITITGGNVSDGGGIFNDGTLTVTNSTLSGNSASDRGGGIFNRDGTLSVTDSTLSGNSADTGGGGIFNRFGTLTVTGSTLSSNSTLGDGGGIYNDEGTTTVTSSTLSGNEADSGSGGGIYNNSGATTVTDSTLSGNKAISDFGGGIYNQVGTLDVSNSTLSGNEAVNGGGIFNRDGTTTVTDSTLSGNPAGDRGGGIFTRDGTMTVASSTFSGNSATNEGGGGIYINGGDLTVTNSTLSGNSAPLGGGIYNDGGTTTVTNATFYGNEGGLAPGASVASTSATTLTNSLLTGSVNGDECSGVTADASNIDDDDSCDSATQKTVGEINLDTTLADNGGPTFTHALLSGSHAIDFDTTASCTAAPVNGLDQRGEPRSVDIPGEGNDGGANLCDTGAYELQPPPTGTITIIKSATPADDTVFSFTDDIESPNSFTLQDPTGDTKTFSNVPTGGSYTVTETDKPGWPLTALACSAAGSSTFDDTNLAGGFIVVTNLDADDTVTCTFTNTQCQPGTYDNGGNECVPAPAGSFVDQPGATEPTECLAGTWQDQEGATECKRADPGFYVPEPGATEQLACEPGFTSEAGATECTIPVGANACPVVPNVGQGTVGSQLTTLYGAGMGSPTRSKMVAKVTIPYANDVTELYGQMAAKAYNGVKYVRFIFGDKSFEQVQPETDLGETAAISWWGADLTAGFQLQAKPFIKGRWFLDKGMKKMKLPRAIVFYATHDTNADYANAWSTFTYDDNFVAGTPGFDQTNSNFLPIPETQAATDITVQVAVTDVNRDPRTVDVIVRAGGVEVTTTLTGPTNKKSELLNLFEVTLEGVPAGTDEVEIELVSVLDEGDSAALLGAAASYICEEPAP